jgi:hypothetical protein
MLILPLNGWASPWGKPELFERYVKGRLGSIFKGAILSQTFS